jgi:hypothetical protein
MPMVTVTPMHKKVHYGARQKDQIWQHQRKVNPMLDQQKTANCEAHHIHTND